MSGVRCVVCGGRTYSNWARMRFVLEMLDATHIAQGGARGADKLAREYAVANGIPLTTYAAEWDVWGAKAGPMRNGKMLRDFAPDVVVAFPGGRGTADMVRRARDAKVPVIEVTDDANWGVQNRAELERIAKASRNAP